LGDPGARDDEAVVYWFLSKTAPKEVRGMSRKGKICKKPKRRWIVVFAVVIAVSVSALAYSQTRQVQDDPIVATVNGEHITFSEMQMAMGHFRIETISYFFSRYGLEFTRDFWETEVDAGYTPLDYIKDRALDFLVERKVQQQFIRDQGLIGDFSHEAFLRDFEAENIHREETIQEGGIVFGVERFDLMTYYEFLFVNQVQRLLTEKGDELFPVTQEDIERFHSENIDNFILPDIVIVDVIGIPEHAVADPYGEIRRAEAALQEGWSFDSVMREFNEGGEPYRVDFRARAATRSYTGDFADIAWALEEGEISAPFEWRSAWFILQSVMRQPGGYRGFEGREHAITVEVRWEMYEAFAVQLIADATVRIINREFNRLYMAV